MKKIFAYVVIVFLLIQLTSCAAIFKGSSENMSLKSEPAGAKVFINDSYYGTTPIQIRLRSDQHYKIEFKKEGFATVTRQVHNHIGAGWIVLDILAGIIPIIVDAATGAWYHLDQTNVNVLLEQQQPRA